MIANQATNITGVRKLQRSLYQSAKDDPRRVYYSLYDKVYRTDVLTEAFARAKRNGGAPGVDHCSWEDIDRDNLIQEIQQELKDRRYKFDAIKRVYIPKSDGNRRGLGIPTVRDRIVETAIQIVMEPIFEANFYEHSYGFRPRKNAHQMIDRATKLINSGYTICIDMDIQKFFDRVDHKILLKSLSFRIKDGSLLKLIRSVLNAPISENGMMRKSRLGCPQGSPLSPLLANIYLTALDRFFRRGFNYGQCVYLRYADDICVLCKPKWMQAARSHLKKGLNWLKLDYNREKSRILNLKRPGSRLTLLGYEILRYRDGQIITRPSKRALQSIRIKIRDAINRHSPKRIPEIIKEANQILVGWTRYFVLSKIRHPFICLSTFTFLRMRKLLLRRAKHRTWRRRRYNFKWIARNLGLKSPYVTWVEERHRLNAFG